MRRSWLALAALALLLPGAAQAQKRPEPEKEISPAAIEAVKRAQAKTDAAAPAAPVSLNAPVAPEPDNIWLLDLSTGGRVTIVLRPDIAPRHIERIKALTRQGFYNGTVFHRVIEGFMAQGGDPTGTGTGSSKLPNLAPEFNDLPHVRGAVAMARAGAPDSANSQFYIVFQPAMKLDHNYTVFGRVVSGMEWADAIERGEPPANPSKIVQASLASDNKPPPAFTPIPRAPLPGVPSLEAAPEPVMPPR